MLRIILRAMAGFSLGLGVSMASAQALGDADQPAEFPPSSYTGKQYVDTRGCVYVRAGFDGAVTWVPRVNRQREVLCGFEPTLAANAAPPPPLTEEEQTTAEAPEVAPAVTPRPVARVAEKPRATPTPVNPRRTTPVRVARAPVVIARPSTGFTPPPGYRPAFEDGRFNPNRGVGTAEGDAQMSLIWTNKVPRRLVETAPVTNAVPITGVSRRVVVAAKNPPPTAPVGGGHRFVQVGLFGVEANARNTAARLQAMGLPVRISSFRKNGKVMRVVLAGPFANPGQVQAGLRAARGAGFADAFPRK